MIKNAQIHFNESGTPVANKFDDVYFSNDDGLAESLYVFYENNNISERLLAHDQNHFVIAETGFGTGLNFLNTWQQWLKLNNSKAKLHFISFEKYPITKSDLQKALSAWPSISALSEQLCAHYPISLEGCHRLEFEHGRIILDLWFGDVHDTLPKMNFTQNGIVDAWYLDGFAPSKNPDMWTQPLFDSMAALSRKNATFATFTAAGFVRRGLQDAGFVCKKVKGYGRKREMVIGELTKANEKATTPPFYDLAQRPLDKVAVIGGGVSSSCLLYHLAKRGIAATLFCQDDALAKGASHNKQAAVYPNLQSENSPSSEFYAHSYLYALRLYKEIAQQGFQFGHQWCGVLMQAVNDAKALQHQKLVEKSVWPQSLVFQVDASEASVLSGTSLPYSGLFYPDAGWVNPAQLTQAMFDAADSLQRITTQFKTDIIDIKQNSDGWYLLSELNKYGPFSDIFICAGEHSDRFSQTKDIDLHGVRGQVSHIQSGPSSNLLKTVICHKGYFTPSDDGHHCMGATFDKNSKSREVTDKDNAKNKAQLMQFYEDTEFVKDLGVIDSAKAAVRCCFNDHLPMLGQVPDKTDLCHAYGNLAKGKRYDFQQTATPYAGLHIVTGFGARGVCSAPLATEHLISKLCNEPSPYSLRVNEAIHPNRFIVRDLIRNKL